MRRNEPSYQIWMKFGRMVDIHDVITYVNFGDDRLRGLAVAGGQILAFPIDIDRRPYNTVALPGECVELSAKNSVRPVKDECDVMRRINYLLTMNNLLFVDRWTKADRPLPRQQAPSCSGLEKACYHRPVYLLPLTGDAHAIVQQIRFWSQLQCKIVFFSSLPKPEIRVIM